jgi:hypothetical protein
MLALPLTSDHQLRDVALCLTMIFTGMRAQDLHRIKEKNVTWLPMDGKVARRYVLTMEVTKTNRDGSLLKTKPSDARCVLPCLCLENMETKEANKFKAQQRKFPKTPCLWDCPYGIFHAYQLRKPNEPPKSKASMEPEDLPFTRALSSRGAEDSTRILTANPLGINELKKLPNVVTALLSE